jgi:hypothetical protein
MLKRSGLATLGLLLLFACNTVRVVPYNQLAALEGEQTVRFFYPSAGGSVSSTSLAVWQISQLCMLDPIRDLAVHDTIM